MSNVVQQKPKFSVAINTPGYQKLINNTLGDPDRAKRFVAAITSAVAVNPLLQDCEAHTILAGALLGESLNLSPSPQLGQYYLVPFNDNKTGTKNAQFILGYKGYIQLAIRSGQYKKINVIEIKEGELKRFDPLNEELEVELIDDWDKREKTATIGYYAMFEYTNGFRKAMYWSREKMMSHADTYSKAFSRTAYEKIKNGEIADKDLWKYSSFWYKNFDDMAKKTLLRQIISHWGVMSIEMQSAFERDDRTLNFSDDGNIVEVDEMPDVQPTDVTQNDGENVDFTKL
jgi:recombination protein RecT